MFVDEAATDDAGRAGPGLQELEPAAEGAGGDFVVGVGEQDVGGADVLQSGVASGADRDPRGDGEDAASGRRLDRFRRGVVHDD
jgi:hypothetical protein